MKRFSTLTWGVAVVTAAVLATNAYAGGKGGNSGSGRSGGFSGGSMSRGGSSMSRSASSMSRGGSFSPSRPTSAIKTAPVKGFPTGGVTRPQSPTRNPVGPVVGTPTRPGGNRPFPGGGTTRPPIKTPVKDPIVGPVKPPVKPPIGPIRPPVRPPIKDPVVGPVKPPVKPPIGPRPPVRPPIKDPVVGPVPPIKPPVGPVPPICPPKPPHCPPHDGHCHPGHGHGHCHKHWRHSPIVIFLPGYVPRYETVVTEVVEVPVPVATPVAPVADASQTAKAPEPAAVDELGKAVTQEAKASEAEKATSDKLPQVPVGATITLAGKDLGETAGQVLVNVNQVVMTAEVVKWESAAATVSMPRIGLAASTKAQLQLLLADGKLANSVEIELIPAEATADTKTDAAKTASTDSQPAEGVLAQK
jgi:hypothetical protein